MKPADIANALEIMVAAKQPAFVWGPPGVGKSQTIKTLAKKMNKQLIDVRAVLLDPVDLRGVPFVNRETGHSDWAPPAFLPREGEGILFIDELNAAPQSTQAAFYQLILDRQLGEYQLPDGWSMVAAGNNATDRAVVHRMPSPIANRFIHYDFDPNVDDWTEWAINNGIKTEIISFVRFRPELLHDFDPNQRSFPTPRSWEFVSKVLGTLPPDLEFETLKGAVGEGAAAEFMGFLKIYRNLPNPDVIIMNPKKAEVPEDPATLYALAGSLSQKADENNWDRVIEYTTRMPAEYQVVLVRDAVQRDNSLANHRCFNDWAAKNANFLR